MMILVVPPKVIALIIIFVFYWSINTSFPEEFLRFMHLNSDSNDSSVHPHQDFKLFFDVLYIKSEVIDYNKQYTYPIKVLINKVDKLLSEDTEKVQSKISLAIFYKNEENIETMILL